MSDKAYFRLDGDANRQNFSTGLWKILKQFTNSHFIHRNNGLAYYFQLQITGPYFFLIRNMTKNFRTIQNITVSCDGTGQYKLTVWGYILYNKRENESLT